MAKPDVRMRQISYDVQFPRELPRRVSVAVFDNKAIVEEKTQSVLPDGALPTLTLLGYGHGNRLTRRTIDWLGRDQGYYAAGVVMPFGQLPATHNMMDAACRQTPHIVADALRQDAHASSDEPINYLGHSQGSGIWGMAHKERPEGLGDASLVIPLGFGNADSLKSPFKTRRGDLLHRFAENTRIQNNKELSVHISNVQIVGNVIFDIVTNRLNGKLEYAFGQLIQDEVVDHVANGHNVAVIAGKNDPVFPPREIQLSLASAQRYADYQPMWVEVPGASHVSTVTRDGKSLLSLGVAALKGFSQGTLGYAS